MRRIGILTGGGDCPGLNRAIRAVVRESTDRLGAEIVGFRNGWQGVIEDDVMELSSASVRGILHRGGTILGSSGADPLMEGGLERVRTTLRDQGVEGLIVIGGEGTLGSAARMTEEWIQIVGPPKTIDNDLSGTDFCIGFHTAVQVATDAIDRLHSTAESHNRVMLVEVMGRSAGWIALYAGIAGGADAILIPERAFDIEEIARHIRRRHARGRSFSIVVVAEGAVPKTGTLTLPERPADERGFPRFGGIASVLAPELERLTGFEARVTVLGHVQRGGTPVANDPILATRLGVAAAEAATAGEWGSMVAAQGNDIVTVPLKEAVAERKQVPEELYGIAEVFFG